MPILKRRHPWMKVFRPNGTRYATSSIVRLTPELAVAGAMIGFEQEFGRSPRQEYALIEVLGVTGGWTATVLEIKE